MNVSPKLAPRLQMLNTLRAAVGKPALTAWKESAAKLEAAITALSPAQHLGSDQPSPQAAVSPLPKKNPAAPLVSEAIANGIKITKVPAGKTAKQVQGKATREAAAKTRAAQERTKSQPRVAANASGDAFKALLTELKMDAKIARAKLRRAGFSAPYDATDKALVAALRADGRTKK